MHKSLGATLILTLIAPPLALAQSTAPMQNSLDLSGSSSAVMNEAQAKQKLEADGYTNVSDIKKDAKGWTAQANFNGKRMTVAIDDAGKIEAQ